MTNKVTKFQRNRVYTHTLVLTLEKPVTDFCLPDELVAALDEIMEDWDCSKNEFYFYNVPDDLEDTYKEKLTAVLEQYG